LRVTSGAWTQNSIRDLDCLAFAHRSVAIRHTVEARDSVKDPIGAIRPSSTSGSSSLHGGDYLSLERLTRACLRD
jgi:hypothetical protein